MMNYFMDLELLTTKLHGSSEALTKETAKENIMILSKDKHEQICPSQVDCHCEVSR